MVAAVENRKVMASSLGLVLPVVVAVVVVVVVVVAAARTFDLLAAEGGKALEACSAVVAWAGGQFNRKSLGLSFGLKTGLRLHFYSEKCLS